MSAYFDSISNRGEYLSAHYFAEQLGGDLKKGIFATWAGRETDEHDPRKTPREAIRSLRGIYLHEDVRGFLAAPVQRDDAALRMSAYDDPQWCKRLAGWHQDVLRALGYDAAPTDLTVHRAGRDHTVSVAFHGHDIVAVDCGWVTDMDAALDPTGADRLLKPLRVSGSEQYETGAALASWLFQSELGGPGGSKPRFVLLLHGGVIVLADRYAWAEGRYLAANLDTALERNDRAQYGELSTIAALFSLDMLRPGDNDRAPAIDALLKASTSNAVGVDADLRHGLQRSVEIIANEVLHRMADPVNDITPAQIPSPRMPFARRLTRESLRYLYRILFLLYAEARPELGILPADDGSYEAGYSMARLRELVARDEELVEEEAKNGFHLYSSLDVLFNKVNFGHRAYGTEPGDDQPGDDEQTRAEKAARRSEDLGLRFEPLRSELFEPTAIQLIGTGTVDPRSDEEDWPRWLDLRLRNEALHAVLRLLTMKKGARGEQGGFISYRNLGINQLGAVYEGLMSYTGIIADEELCEVARGGDPEQGSWLIPSRRQDQYPDGVLVHHDEHDARRGLRGVKKYPEGSFVYRLAGRDRETSASYYTPESLTKVTVELALKERLDQDRDTDGNVIKTRAAELLTYKICEPALGSGAFLNEAINQVAEEYLRRRQEELGRSVPTSDLLTEKQRVKAYIALHNAYGVDLNPMGVELAEVSLWLNTMHPGMRAPWFGLHLRRGNSLIGARRAVYAGDDVSSPAKEWLKARGGFAPTPLPFQHNGAQQPLPDAAVHQFLLPSPGWAAVAGNTEAKKLAPDAARNLAAWRKGILQRPARSSAHVNKDGSRKLLPNRQPKPELPSQFTRLRDAARRVEYLWSLVIKRMEISEREVARHIQIWGADATDPEYSFLHRPQHAIPKEQVLRDLFNAVDTPYWRLKHIMDAWCALWFWPTDEAALLDGTAAEYTAPAQIMETESVAELLGGIPLPEAVDAPPEPPAHEVAPALAPVRYRAVALFPVDGEQGSFEDLDWGVDQDTAIQEKKPRPAASKKAPKRPALRPTIPLKDLDDWLDFLEAMLGIDDAPGTFVEGYGNLDDMKKLEDILPEFMGMDTADPESRFPWLRVVRDIADRHGFLHWELEFASTFATRGGFDLQVGNPPWVRPVWDEAAVLAEREPWFVLTDKPMAAERAQRRTVQLANRTVRTFVMNELNEVVAIARFLSDSSVYPLLAGSQPDLYRAFMCQTWTNMADSGSIGLLHPDSHFSGENDGPLRAASYSRLRVHGDFVNAGNRFFPHPVGRHTHFGVHVYGPPGNIGFSHLSWLFSAEALRSSANHDGTGEDPGVRFNGSWDERPHLKRVVHISREVLSKWRLLFGESQRPVEETALLSPVSTAEAAAIEALAQYPVRAGAFALQITSGLHETGAREAGLIEFAPVESSDSLKPHISWEEVILKGPQLGVANPMFKQPSQNVGRREVLGLNLSELSASAVPESEYTYVVGRDVYLRAHDIWLDRESIVGASEGSDQSDLAKKDRGEVYSGTPASAVPESVDASLKRYPRRPCVDFYRLAWRSMIAPNTERALYAALIPPGPSHIHGIHSLAMPSLRHTALLAGFWHALPVDYFLRATGRGHLLVGGVKTMPAPDLHHPLASALLLRTLRLNCLTSAYSKLWSRLYEPSWHDSERWACVWPGMSELHGIGHDWEYGTPLRSERSRRAALVEIDALVAVWMGISADAVVAMYRARFPVLQDFEAVTWFDAAERKIAGNRYAVGHGQGRDDWLQFLEYLRNRESLVPDGYTPPFYKADREGEMRAAHAVFQARLDAAVARGEWDPVTRRMVAS
ncbi:class I SAM-dependent DNA methyltransferase [Dactylosporangium aurantiacum]|uniref:site-specific DNA-methyltransferase (adenine-specific) n=1 Tax=Dactylosporangium aurantiacum TaxID=35754 RepID=A0A9Q9IDX8_9ACTN|nr:hypothetical protein [Dactylosporangium aurantiacum]MDG6101943.1 class I SAM-dependent DNA methyltransferase [Dactylosporangium aurantiacum]UWZ52267.1 class I SAM-dependent DNA methyltransferase [Dactylosporangium aurantiacum]